MDDEDRRWLFGEVVSTVAGNGSVVTSSANENAAIGVTVYADPIS